MVYCDILQGVDKMNDETISIKKVINNNDKNEKLIMVLENYKTIIELLDKNMRQHNAFNIYFAFYNTKEELTHMNNGVVLSSSGTEIISFIEQFKEIKQKIIEQMTN